MHPLVAALFSAWDLRPVVLAVLALMSTLYTVGWWRLRHRRGRQGRLATRWRLALYWIGLFFLAASLMSPVDLLGSQLFSFHMLQHMLSMFFAAPLLLFALPFAIGMWGLPRPVRPVVTALLTRDSWFRTCLAAVSQPGVVWLIFLIFYYGWHEPMLYNLALRRPWVHDIQHIMFFSAALLFWWTIIGGGPVLHRRFSPWGKIAFLIASVPPNMAVGVWLSLSGEVVYTYYNSIPRVWGLTVMQDQQLGGVIMWIPGSMMFLMAALVIMGILFLRKEPLPEPVSHAT